MTKALHKYTASKIGIDSLKTGDHVEITPQCPARAKLGLTRVRVLTPLPKDNKRVRTITVACVRTEMQYIISVKNIQNIYFDMPKAAMTLRERKGVGNKGHTLTYMMREYLIARADYYALEYETGETKAAWQPALDAKDFWHERILHAFGLDTYLYGSDLHSSKK